MPAKKDRFSYRLNYNKFNPNRHKLRFSDSNSILVTKLLSTRCLEGECLASGTNNRGLDLGGAKQVVVVGNRLQGSSLSSVLSASEVVVVGHSIARVGRVEGLLATNKGVGLDQKLGTLAGVDAVGNVLVVAVVDVASTETEGRTARVDVVPVVVVLGDVQVTGVLIAVAVGVSDQGGLPVVVDEGVRDSDEVGSVGNLVRVSICRLFEFRIL